MHARPAEVPPAGHAAALRRLVGAIAVAVAGSMMFLLVPVLMEALRRHAPWLGEQQIGLVGSADAAGMFLGTLLALAMATRIDRRWLGFAGLAILMAANLAAWTAHHALALLALRVLAGLGGGLAVGVGHAAFAATRVPDRSIALYLIAQTAVGSGMIALLSRMIPTYGPGALYLATAALALVACVFVPALPPRAKRVATPAATGMPAAGMRGLRLAAIALLCLGSNLLLGAAFTAAWANVESIGKAMGLDNAGVAAGMSMALIAAMAGSILVALLGNRLGRALPFLLVSALSLAGMLLLALARDLPAYTAALLMMMFGTSSTSYVFGALSSADAQGRLSIAHPLSLKAGFAIGPALGSFLIVRGGYSAMLWWSMLGTAMVIAMALLAFRLLRKPGS